MCSGRLGEIEEDDDRGIADGCVVAGEAKATGFAVHAKDRDVVSPLIAGIQELAAGIKIEAARLVSACPCLADERQFAIFTDRENSDAVMQPIAGIHEPTIA